MPSNFIFLLQIEQYIGADVIARLAYIERFCVRLLHDAFSIKRKPPARTASADGVLTAHPVNL
jgi:hypothetical protein